MLSLWLLCVLFAVCMALILRARLKESYGYKLPPSHYGTLPIIGITHLFISDPARFWETIKKTSEDCVKKGGLTITKVGGDAYYFVTDPEDAMTVANSCLQKHFLYKFFKPYLGEGLVTGIVPIWQRHRKLLIPAFSLPIINGYLEVFNAQNRKMVDHMAAHVGKGPFDPSLLIKETILAISCLNVFGTSDMHNSDFLKNYMTAVEKLLYTSTQRFQKFWLQSDVIYKLSGEKKKEDIFIKTLSKMSEAIIQKKKIALSKGQVQMNDIQHKALIDIILPMTTNDILNDTEVKNELDTAIIAAYETTLNVLQCILILLGSNPDIQERVLEELIQILGPERDVEKEDVPKLAYTEAVIKETLRFLPNVPILLRYIDRDLNLKNYTIPAGSQCGILPYGIHRDPVWGTDAELFRPERWLNAATLPPNASAFAGFSFGKRGCIGKTYAMMAIKVSLAHLIRKYKIRADYSKVKFKLTMTLKSEVGNEISIQSREFK